MDNFQTRERYLRLLSERFPNADAVVTELINLQAILSLPKGTEHFVSDLHGASNAFIHMIKNASGVIRARWTISMAIPSASTRSAPFVPSSIILTSAFVGCNSMD